MNNAEKRAFVVEKLTEAFGADKSTLTRAEVNEALGPYVPNVIAFPYWVTHKRNRLPNGEYKFPVLDPEAKVKVPSVPKPREKKAEVFVDNLSPSLTPGFEEEKAQPVSLIADSLGFDMNLVPKKNQGYIKFGFHKDLVKVIKSTLFYPVFITGLSGNGKTHMTAQVCSELKREMIRVNLTEETDEDDLIGGFRLVNGETKFFKGPVIKAMERGAVLLLDELDLATPSKIMCLQSILEGSGYFIKKTGEFIQPAPGFTVVATGNTKGNGSDDGRFIGTNVLNEAFLERFPMTIEQAYPPLRVETRILSKLYDKLGMEDDGFIDKLVNWADMIRKSFESGAEENVISTRRLIHIVKAYAIFNDRLKAVEYCINRFDETTKLSFMDLYAATDEGVNLKEYNATNDVD